jgi:hypothetical protein
VMSLGGDLFVSSSMHFFPADCLCFPSPFLPLHLPNVRLCRSRLPSPPQQINTRRVLTSPLQLRFLSTLTRP